MKHFFMALFILSVQLFYGQVYVCKDGITKFTSEAPLELIKAQSSKTSGAIDCATKNVAFSVLIDSFDGFNSGLQKEHFQENYLETAKYTTGNFKGKIIEDIDFTKPATVTVRAKGNFTIHGVEKEKIIKVKLTIKNREIIVDTDFEVALDDHNIKIPKIVNQKIASVIRVEVNAVLKPKA